MSIGPHCTVIGSANVHSLAPEIVDSNGDIIVDEPEYEIGALEDPESAINGEDGEYLGDLEGEEALHFEGEGAYDAEAEGEGEGEGEKKGKKSKKHHSKKSKKDKGADDLNLGDETAGGEVEPAVPV